MLPGTPTSLAAIALALALAVHLQGPCLRQVVDEPLAAEEGADGRVEAAARQRLGQRDLQGGRSSLRGARGGACLLPACCHRSASPQQHTGCGGSACSGSGRLRLASPSKQAGIPCLGQVGRNVVGAGDVLGQARPVARRTGSSSRDRAGGYWRLTAQPSVRQLHTCHLCSSISTGLAN